MANFYLNPEITQISIPSFTTIENVEFYKILIKCFCEKEWIVERRYKEFLILDNCLKSFSALETLLPKKKIMKNRDFIEKRKTELEKYLQNTLRTFVNQMPIELVEFLDLHLYDINFLLDNLATKLSLNDGMVKFSILEV